jgi:hypothetical protein
MASNGDIKGEVGLIVALARGDSHRHAARASGVGLRTVTRRMGDPGFVAAVQAERARLVQRAIGRLADRASGFVDVLWQVARDTTAPAGARVSAARAGLELGVRLREADEVEQRLSRLEAAKPLDALDQIHRDVAELSPEQIESELRAWAADIGLKEAR